MDWAQVKAAQGIDVTSGFADFIEWARFTYSNDMKVSWTTYPRFGDYVVACLDAVAWLVAVLATYYFF